MVEQETSSIPVFTVIAHIDGRTVYYHNGKPLFGSRRSNQESQPEQVRPGLSRPDGSHDGDGSQTRPDSVQGNPQVNSAQRQGPVGSAQGVPNPGSIQGQPGRLPIQGGGHFGK